ncbi:MAG: SET domain-containing protein [Melioribacteraceae bacterium]|nr:SET domain-containing protein [Melioribacteraceae bacterium]
MIYKKDFEEFVVVKDSKIHGKGIFATGFIPQGELVMVVSGDVIDEDECVRRENEEDNVYIFWNGDTYIDTNHYGKIRYINHDCDPNSEVMDRDEETLNLVAIKDIHPGDEIVIDYGYEEIYEDCTCKTCMQKGLKQKAS